MYQIGTTVTQRWPPLKMVMNYKDINMNNNNLPIISDITVRYTPQYNPTTAPVVTNSKAAAEIFYERWNHDTIRYREEALVMFLDTQKRVIGTHLLGIGANNQVIIDPKQVFTLGLLTNADTLIIAHNHPSGSLEASSNDVALWNRLKNVGTELGLKVIDFLIITHRAYNSFTDSGITSFPDTLIKSKGHEPEKIA